VHCDPQSVRKTQIEPIKGWVGQHNISDRPVAFESDRHLTLPPLYRRQDGRMQERRSSIIVPPARGATL
jgi:hypothetical protein